MVIQTLNKHRLHYRWAMLQHVGHHIHQGFNSFRGQRQIILREGFWIFEPIEQPFFKTESEFGDCGKSTRAANARQRMSGAHEAVGNRLRWIIAYESQFTLQSRYMDIGFAGKYLEEFRI